jgi:hypothetical protein
MQEWDKYKLIKIDRGELVNMIKNKSQKDWMKVCEKLGILVRVDYGKGSHIAVYKDNCPPEDRKCCIVTIQKNLHSEIQRDIFKKILTYGIDTKKYTEDDIWKALGVLS